MLFLRCFTVVCNCFRAAVWSYCLFIVTGMVLVLLAFMINLRISRYSCIVSLVYNSGQVFYSYHVKQQTSARLARSSVRHRKIVTIRWKISRIMLLNLQTMSNRRKFHQVKSGQQVAGIVIQLSSSCFAGGEMFRGTRAPGSNKSCRGSRWLISKRIHWIEGGKGYICGAKNHRNGSSGVSLTKRQKVVSCIMLKIK